MSKRMKAVFTLSLLLNIILIGAGAGLFYRFAMDAPIPGNMTPEARHFMARTFQEGRDRVKPLIRQVKADKARVAAIITAEEFDRDAYNAAVSEMMDTKDKIARERAEIMGEALADLPHEDRQRFAERLLDGLTGKRPHRKGYHHKFERPRGPEEGSP